MKSLLIFFLMLLVLVQSSTLVPEVVTSTTGSLCLYNCSVGSCTAGQVEDTSDCNVTTVNCNTCNNYVVNAIDYSYWLSCLTGQVFFYDGFDCESTVSSSVNTTFCFTLGGQEISWADCTTPENEAAENTPSRQAEVIVPTILVIIVLILILGFLAARCQRRDQPYKASPY